ncbi:hypothetical protein ACFSZS_20715 [Seohaeicola zhoushanensis]
MSLAAISLTNALLYARQEETLEIETRARQELTRVNKLKMNSWPIRATN